MFSSFRMLKTWTGQILYACNLLPCRGTGVSALYALFLPRGLYMDMKINGIEHSLDTGLCQYIIYAGIILAVFCSLYLGS